MATAGISPAAAASSTAYGDVEDSKSDRGTVVRSLRRQIEEYLSVDNLDTDERLRACMDAQGYIPLDELSQLKMIAEWDVGRPLIVEAIRGSKKLEMDAKESMVKSLPLVERTTLILRDMPQNARKEEILKIFAFEQCGRVKEIRSDIGNTWFVKFFSEQDCLRTVRYLQKKGSFRENPLHVRVKPSSLHTTAASRGFAPPYRPAPKPQKTTYYGPPARSAYPAPGGATGTSALGGRTAQDSGADRRGPSRGPSGASNPYLNPHLTSGAGYTGSYGYTQTYGGGGSPPYRGPLPQKNRSRPGREPRPPPQSTVAATTGTEPRDEMAANGGGTQSPPSAAPKKATSDYPGLFKFYDKGKFMRAYNRIARRGMPPIPHSMAGRDQRVVSEVLLTPMFVIEIEEAAAEREAAIQAYERQQKEREEFLALEEPRVRYQYGDGPPFMDQGPDDGDDLENDPSGGNRKGGGNRRRKKKRSGRKKQPRHSTEMDGPLTVDEEDLYARLAREYTFAHADVRDAPGQGPVARDVRSNRAKSRKQQRRRARRKQAKAIAAQAAKEDVRDMNDVRDMRDVRKASQSGGGTGSKKSRSGGGASGASGASQTKKQPRTTWVPRQT